jgi:hypothetical protein
MKGIAWLPGCPTAKRTTNPAIWNSTAGTILMNCMMPSQLKVGLDLIPSDNKIGFISEE